ncbi:type I secretion system permease/ATPase [Alcaligenes sp. 1735tsa3]|jgi:ATP-binding cassette subfamily C protein LapB|uniref:type I secretion system permease/ATPase n=2 Tax=Alcaligenes TaxID=507 RepID=UPI00052D0CAD|nr:MULTISPECIES: type I secretion system permease/ATPase [Alcaligenes]KGP02834.1 ABC transporter [Alcaligenes faecalis]USY25369.1 type I secretion system permease/ATPase [Alcaligenes sp. 1735tsa3]SSY85563.1 RTX-I toxin determinant B [Alcaligenes faecalis subsp. faecalis]
MTMNHSSDSTTQASGQYSIPPHLTHDDPLLTCLAEITRIHGNPCTPQHLSAGLPLQRGRLTPALLSRAAARGHCTARVWRRAFTELDTNLFPVILLLNNNRACVLLGLEEERARVHFPESGSPSEISLEDLQAQYSGLLAVVQPDFRVEARAKDGVAPMKGKHWFWTAVVQNWRLYRDAIGAALLINLFALAIPLYTMNVYDRVVPNKAIETLWVLSIGIGLVLVMNMVLSSVRAYVVDAASKRVDIQLSARIMERVLDLRMENRPPSVGSFAANLRSFESVRDFIASASLTTLVDLPFVLLFLAVLAWISPWMLIPPVVAIVIILGISWFAQARMERLTKQTFQAAAQRNAGLVESLAGMETLKVLNAQSNAQRDWEQSTEYLARQGARIKMTSTLTVNTVQMLQQMVTISVVIIGVYLVQETKLSMGGIIASSMIAGRCLAPLGQVAGLMMQYQNARTSLGSVDSYMNMPVEHPEERHFVPRPYLEGSIEFRNVSFSYPGTTQNVLDKVSFSLKAGEKIGIIGRIGSGKTTLSKLILGLYKPTGGTVVLDGIDSQQIDPADVRRSMGYVSQDPTLFYGTLKHNLLMGTPYATDDQMLAAARQAGVDDFARRHPDGYDMMIGERGESLSGGQRQAIAVARALIGNPSILLLDEPSSNMDNQSESALRRSLHKECEGKTVVLVTHRTALLELVDRLIVMDMGRIVADGPKDQVIAALRSGQIGKARSAA